MKHTNTDTKSPRTAVTSLRSETLTIGGTEHFARVTHDGRDFLARVAIPSGCDPMMCDLTLVGGTRRRRRTGPAADAIRDAVVAAVKEAR